jgi:hypothetical protein
MKVAKKEGKSKEEKLADGKRKKQRIREKTPHNGHCRQNPLSNIRNSYKEDTNR